MKERRLKIIVTLMAIAVTGLIALQIYWISNLIRVEKERFQRTVNDALYSTSEMLEKNEAANNLISKMSNGQNNLVYFIQKGNSPVTAQKFDSTKKMQYVRVESKNNSFRYEVRYFGQADTGKKILLPHVLYKRDINKSPSKVTVTSLRDSSGKDGKKTIQNVFTEIIEAGSRKKIEERVSQDQIQKLLTEQLNNRGINLDFNFGVHKVEKDSLTLIKPGTDISELKNSNFKVALFPDEVIRSEPNQLLVYFPHQNRYLIGSIMGMLGLSVGLILVIVAVFYKTVGMFLKQKKITEVKNDLVNNITHEFKTPIATISLACEALNEPGLTAEKNSIRRFSKIIKEENDRLKIMVDALLNTAAMEKDEINFKKENLNLHKLIVFSTSKINELITQRNGNIHFELNASAVTIAADKFHMTNIFSNLIDNAIKYNQRSPEILISTFNEGNFIHINIKDNGIGISKEHIDKIFDTFYRVSKGNIQDIRGNGIGLSYAKKIIEAHNGSISVESEPGVGSVFTIILPVADDL